MKIAIPVNENNCKELVSPSFGRATYYYIYDTMTKIGSFIDNIAAQSAGEAGIKAAQFLVDNNVKIIIAPRYGENPAKVLLDANIKVFKNIAGSVEDNILAYENNKLEFLADIHLGHHGKV